MNCVKLHQSINQIISLFYRLGFWHQGEKPTVKETRLKIFYFIYYSFFPISLIAGAIKNDNRDESIFLVEVAIAALVLSLKLFYVMWKQKKILELLNQICVYSIDDRLNFTLVDNKFKLVTKCVNFLLVPSYIAGVVGALVVPFLGTEKKLFYDVGFPLDWKNNEFAYWIAFTFVSTEIFLTAIIILFSVIIWYLMISCALKYEILGDQTRKMGEIKIIETRGEQRKITKLEKENTFLGHLIEAVQFNNRIREEIQQMESFLSLVFLTQVATSGLCICGSIYCLIFSVSENLTEYMIHLAVLFYNLFEIFMVMYFGNEITLLSDSLTYCFFESDWTDQSESSKKLLITFGEMLKQPYTLVVGKLYPLTLETFTRILNSAYSMFNILKDLK